MHEWCTSPSLQLRPSDIHEHPNCYHEIDFFNYVGDYNHSACRFTNAMGSSFCSSKRRHFWDNTYTTVADDIHKILEIYQLQRIVERTTMTDVTIIECLKRIQFAFWKLNKVCSLIINIYDSIETIHTSPLLMSSPFHVFWKKKN